MSSSEVTNPSIHPNIYRPPLSIDHRFYNYELKVVAAAALAFLRKQAGIVNIWNEHLQKLTGLEHS